MDAIGEIAFDQVSSRMPGEASDLSVVGLQRHEELACDGVPDPDPARPAPGIHDELRALVR